MPDAHAPIAVFDSGLGGLSVLAELGRQLPREHVVYFGDTLHMPYGRRPLEEVKGFCFSIVGRFAALPCKPVVVACNTASAAALKPLRAAFPDMPFVGMEPAVKPAATLSKTGRVGVLATHATFQGQLFESVVERFAKDVEVIRQPCPGLAEFIEQNPPDHPGLEPLLRRFITPLVERGVDNLVLGCTHYPLVKDAIAAVAGPGVAVIDPSPAIARRVRQVLEEKALLADGGGGGATFFVSGDAEGFSRSAAMILGCPVEARQERFSSAM